MFSCHNLPVLDDVCILPSVQTRNVDPSKRLGELPEFVSHILPRLRSFPGTDNATDLELDQLTVIVTSLYIFLIRSLSYIF